MDSCGANHFRFESLSTFVLRIGGHESKNQEVHQGSEGVEAKENKKECEDPITSRGALLLQCDIIAKSNRRQGNEAVINRIKIRPAFKMRETGRSRRYHNKRY